MTDCEVTAQLVYSARLRFSLSGCPEQSEMVANSAAVDDGFFLLSLLSKSAQTIQKDEGLFGRFKKKKKKKKEQRNRSFKAHLVGPPGSTQCRSSPCASCPNPTDHSRRPNKLRKAIKQHRQSQLANHSSLTIPIGSCQSSAAATERPICTDPTNTSSANPESTVQKLKNSDSKTFENTFCDPQKKKNIPACPSPRHSNASCPATGGSESSEFPRVGASGPWHCATVAAGGPH